jgi:hypothetical protein
LTIHFGHQFDHQFDHPFWRQLDGQIDGQIDSQLDGQMDRFARREVWCVFVCYPNVKCGVCLCVIRM